MAILRDDNLNAEDNAALRFDVGSLVDCWYGTGWVTGKVVRLHYNQPGWGQRTVPYQVRLPTGQLIYAPRDTDEVIRAGNAGTAWHIVLAALEPALQLIREQGTLPDNMAATLATLSAAVQQHQ